jgi:hypothetical protein
LTVPPKALIADTRVTFTETSISPPKEFIDWSPIYEISASNNFPAVAPMTVRLFWSNRGGVVPALNVYHAKDRNSPFVALTDTLPNAGVIDAATTEFGLFFVGFAKTAAEADCP